MTSNNESSMVKQSSAWFGEITLQNNNYQDARALQKKTKNIKGNAIDKMRDGW